MTFDLLPQDEPGNPLPDTPPGFTENLMRRIADYRRQQRRRRRTAIVLATICLAGAAYLLAVRWIGDVPKVDIVEKQARLAAPMVSPPVPQPATPQEAVKREESLPQTPAHNQPPAPPVPQEAMTHGPRVTRSVSVTPRDALAPPGISPDNVKITVDGKEVDQAQLDAILRNLDGCTPRRVVMVRDGKSMTYIVHPPHESDSQCTSAPPPRE